MLNIGCTTRAFNGKSVADTAARMHEIGFLCTELCFVHEDLPGWTYNGMGSLDGPPKHNLFEVWRGLLQM